jgi:hypothetical protein
MTLASRNGAYALFEDGRIKAFTRGSTLKRSPQWVIKPEVVETFMRE